MHIHTRKVSQAEGTASTKALRPDCPWHVHGAVKSWRGADGVEGGEEVTVGRVQRLTARTVAVSTVQGRKLQWPQWSFGLTLAISAEHLTGKCLRVSPGPSCLPRLPRGRTLLQLSQRCCLDTVQARLTGFPPTDFPPTGFMQSSWC